MHTVLRRALGAVRVLVAVGSSGPDRDAQRVHRGRRAPLAHKGQQGRKGLLERQGPA